MILIATLPRISSDNPGVDSTDVRIDNILQTVEDIASGASNGDIIDLLQQINNTLAQIRIEVRTYITWML
jgi:hypothetical protein